MTATAAPKLTEATAAARPRRAALYVRQSKDSDAGVERQIERTTALVTLRGWTAAGTYVDNDVTASKPRGAGTAWGRMLADRAAGLLDVVVGVDLDRVVRSTRDLNTLIDAGLALVTVDGEIDLTTADGEFRASMLAALARFEVRRKGERQTRANRQRAERGGVPKGTRLTGYETDGTVREDEAATVRALFDGFSKGDSLRTLAARFDSTPSTVRGILTNPRYAGRRVYKGAVVSESGQWPALVSGERFDIVQARITDPRRKTNQSGSTARKHLGSGFYLCACQTETVDGEPRPRPGALRVVSGGTGDRYRCRVCGMSRNREQVDAYVVGTLLARLSQPDALAALTPQPVDVSELLTEQEAIKARLRKLALLVADGTLTDEDVRAAAEPLRVRLAEVQRRIGAASTPPILASLEGSLDRLEEVLPTLPTERRRALAAAFLTVTLDRAPKGRKTFDPDSVRITWRA